MTKFDSNTFEHDYIVRMLNDYLADLKSAATNSAREHLITDKYACTLTAFMVGQIRQACATNSEAKGEIK